MNPDPWQSLKKFTSARIAIGRAGTSIPLQETLAFRLAHAHARDAVYSALNYDVLRSGLAGLRVPVLEVQSRAANRHVYLQRPDLGRLPDEASQQALLQQSAPGDICIVLADGLSADAVNRHALPLLRILLPLFASAGYSLLPVCIAAQARVAIADPIAATLGARLSLILIGERPGLSAADSMGAYLTYEPRPGRTDESRNCISNIRPEGLPYQPAAEKIFYLVQQVFLRRLSGIQVKDDSGEMALNQDLRDLKIKGLGG